MRRSPLTPAQIKAIFDAYTSNNDEIVKYNIGVNTITDKQAWIDNYVKRTGVLRRIYEETEKSCSAIYDAINATEGLRYNQAEAFFHAVAANYVTLYDDPFFDLKMFEMLTRFYEKENDILRLLPMLCRLGYEYTTTLRLQCQDHFDKALNCFKKVIFYRDKYNLIPDLSIRKQFFIAYEYLICIMVGFNREFTIDQSAKYMLEMLDFFESPVVSRLDKHSPEILEIIEKIKYKWLGLTGYIDIASYDTKQIFIKIAHEVYDSNMKICQGDIYKLRIEVLIAYYRTLIFEGNCTYQEAVRKLTEYYFTRRQMPAYEAEVSEASDKALSPDTIDFEVILPDIVLQWLDNVNIPDEECNKYRRLLVRNKTDFLIENSERLGNFYTVNGMMLLWCRKTLKYYDTIDEKEKALTGMILNRNLCTFFHSRMVAELSRMIAKEILNVNPSMFLDILDYSSEEEILKNSDNILEYIRKAALIHDLGENNIAFILDTQLRSLTDEELKVIRMHPDIGIRELDDDLHCYHDIILGHHVSYDMRNGYPSHFDPDESKVKLICDLILICDALDAATDYLDRYYAPTKSFAEVMLELIKGSGTSYNPEIVSIIRSNEELSERINNLLTNRREEYYYDWFINYFNKTCKL
ncbi:MAG: HD domain-containing protein [Lachnospiraceae bacterium]|nr:HD domain-containing protein [Lachnospiraceae bacterium]